MNENHNNTVTDIMTDSLTNKILPEAVLYDSDDM